MYSIKLEAAIARGFLRPLRPAEVALALEKLHSKLSPLFRSKLSRPGRD